jgi:hypothetical protein
MTTYNYLFEGPITLFELDGHTHINLRNHELGASVVMALPESMEKPPYDDKLGTMYTGGRISVTVEISPETLVRLNK